VLLAAQSSGAGDYSMLLIMGALFVGIYFLMIRPQQKRRREVESMQRAMGPGDEVVTVGGLYGVITEVDDDTVWLEIAPDVVARYARGAISKVVNAAERVDEDEAVDETEAVTEEPAPKRADSD
jgi:preprotein translocase subunit YajC